MASSSDVEFNSEEWPHGNGTYGCLTRFDMNPLNMAPITATYFDPYEELLWTGNANGRVASFFASNAYSKYSAFCASTTSDVRALEGTERNILALTGSTLKVNTKQGISLFNKSFKELDMFTSLHRLPNSSMVFIGGLHELMIEFDFVSQKEVKHIQLLKDETSNIVKTNSGRLFSSDNCGNITIRTLNSRFDVIKTLNAHGGPITDFDIHGNRLITCGSSMRFGSLHGDPYVKIYDLRTMKTLPPLPLSFAPSFLRFMPTYCESRVIMISQLGQVQITNLEDRNPGMSMVVETEGCPLSAFHFSSTKQLLSFGDEIGTVHVYADQANPTVNASSFETEMASPLLGPPHSFNIDDTNTCLASVPLPFSVDDGYLSDWPEELCERVYRSPKPLPERTILKTIQFLTYAKNPNAGTPLCYFSVVPYVLNENETQLELSSVEDSELVIPRFYRKLALKKNKSGRFEGNVFLKHNQSKLIPFEVSQLGGFVHPILLLLYQVNALRNVFLSHICDDQHCFVCQQGFVFRMMSDKAPSVANETNSSSNLIRSLVASEGCPMLTGDIFSGTHSIFEYFINSLQKALIETKTDGRMRELLQTSYSVNHRCVRCDRLTNDDESALSLTINYSAPSAHNTLALLIEKSFRAQGAQGFCNSCNVKSIKEESRKIKQFPSILLVDANASCEKYHSFWKEQLSMTERRPRYQKPSQECSLDSDSKKVRQCRYGDECRNKQYCLYTHGDDEWQLECATWLEDTGGQWRHFVSESIFARVNAGIAIMSEDKREGEESEEYELVGAVFAVANAENAWTHSVAVLRDHSEQSLPWILVNDMLVTKTHKDEALHMDSRWKLPLLFCYARKSANLYDAADERIPIPETIFQTDSNLTGDDEVARERRTWKLPDKGEVVGIDAEFININQDVKKSVGRVSVVDSSGERTLIDDYVVTCDGDVVDDYLTQYSGIMEHDLDPARSTKHLTTLKRVYMKLLHLIERGVIFVGHGLCNDFSVLNIHVPSEQMRDTVQLFHLPQQRMISLQFLAWHLLGEKIQVGFHDSVEDARIALKLYEKWQELKEDGTLDSVVHKLYSTGKECNWRLSANSSKSSSPNTD